MNVNIAKNIIITLLIVTAIFQTNKLWFGDPSGRNLFSFSQNDVANDKTNIATIDLKPNKIIISYGNRNFNIITTELSQSNIKTWCDEALEVVLKNGKFVQQDNTLEDILKQKCIIYDYGFSIPAYSYIESFSVSTPSVPLKIKSFDKVFILPSRNAAENFKVFFADTKNSQLVEFSVSSRSIKNNVSGNLIAEIEQMQKEEKDLVYISALISGFGIFKQDEFIPQWSRGDLAYAPVVMSNPFMIDGELHMQSLEQSMDLFFANPAIKWKDKDMEGTYIFSDENTSVKYSEYGVLEYSNYNANEKSEDDSFFHAYQETQKFIKKDITLNNEYYLSKYEYKDDSWYFYFDYKINNYPIYFSKDLMEQTGMSHGIEIIVKDNVKKYKRFVCNFKTDILTKEQANVDFLAAINSAISTIKSDTKLNIDSIALGYKTQLNSPMKLNWFIDIENTQYVSPTDGES